MQWFNCAPGHARPRAANLSQRRIACAVFVSSPGSGGSALGLQQLLIDCDARRLRKSAA
jgi:hypothetical protein